MFFSHFSSRGEYKYFIPFHLTKSFLNDLEMFTIEDKNNSISDGYYPVSSIYFENSEFKSYLEKINGEARRFKIRVRYYSSQINNQINLELKVKILETCFKNKILIDKKEFEQFLFSDSYFLNKIINKDNQKLKIFLYLKNKYNFRPFLQINYQRKAFFAKNDKKIRINLDKNICCQRWRKNRIKNFQLFPVLPLEAYVLEIKFSRYFPYWLVKIIQKYSLKKNSISKYALAVQKLALNESFCV